MASIGKSQANREAVSDDDDEARTFAAGRQVYKQYIIPQSLRHCIHLSHALIVLFKFIGHSQSAPSSFPCSLFLFLWNMSKIYFKIR